MPAEGGPPGSLASTPRLDDWIQVLDDGEVIVRTGKAELGQGIDTALVAIAADELGVEPATVRVEGPRTGTTPNEWVTAGSQSIQTTGMAVRHASAHARRMLVERAASRFGLSVSQLDVSNGRVVAPDGRSIGYGELAGAFDWSIDRPATTIPRDARRWTGRSLARVDLPDKIRGRPAFLHDMRLPGMRFGRVLRPPRPGAELIGEVPTFASGAEVVRNGSFVAVVADTQYGAMRAGDALAVRLAWRGGATFPADGDDPAYLAMHIETSHPIVEGCATDDVLTDRLEASAPDRRVSARYAKPFIMHGAIGPSVAIAAFDGERLEVWSHSQGVELLRMSLGGPLGLSPEQIVVTHVDGAGCYGHNGADDAAMDAAVIAVSRPGRPVMVQWTREDEHRWEPFGPAMVVDIDADIDEGGRITVWQHDVYTYPHVSRPFRDPPGVSALLAAWYLSDVHRPVARRSMGFHGGGHRNADPLYEVGTRRIVKHEVGGAHLRTSSTRSLGAFANVFAIESFMDEIATATDQDPVELRIRHLIDPRAIDVIRAAIALAGGLDAPGGVDAPGRGLGFARYENSKAYAAVVVELDVDPRTGEISLRHGWIAADAGEVIDPDGTVNQLEGNFIQAASWTLKERVDFSPAGATDRDWQSYPIMRFSEAPRLTTRLIDRPEQPPLGVGEAVTGPVPAAIANALAQLTTVRMRRLPLVPARVLAALDALAGLPPL